MTGGLCTSKIFWWVRSQRSAKQTWWISVDDVCVFQDAYARGEVFIGSKESGYTVLPGLPPNIQGSHWQFGITIVTPDRKFLFACETEQDQKDWITAFQTVINRPMLPQDYAGLLLKITNFLFMCPPPKTRVFSTFSLQWRHFLNTNHERRGHRRRRWSLHQHNPHHLPGPHHQVEDPIQR